MGPYAPTSRKKKIPNSQKARHNPSPPIKIQAFSGYLSPQTPLGVSPSWPSMPRTKLTLSSRHSASYSRSGTLSHVGRTHGPPQRLCVRVQSGRVKRYGVTKARGPFASIGRIARGVGTARGERVSAGCPINWRLAPAVGSNLIRKEG